MSGNVLCAVTLPIANVATIVCLPPALPSPLHVLLPPVAIALFVAIAIAITIALATLSIALFDAHRCALFPPTAIHICSDGSIGGSLAAAKAVARRH